MKLAAKKVLAYVYPCFKNYQWNYIDIGEDNVSFSSGKYVFNEIFQMWDVKGCIGFTQTTRVEILCIKIKL